MNSRVSLEMASALLHRARSISLTAEGEFQKHKHKVELATEGEKTVKVVILYVM